MNNYILPDPYVPFVTSTPEFPKQVPASSPPALASGTASKQVSGRPHVSGTVSVPPSASSAAATRSGRRICKSCIQCHDAHRKCVKRDEGMTCERCRKAGNECVFRTRAQKKSVKCDRVSAK